MKITIDEKLCIGCGLCADDCSRMIIFVHDGVASCDGEGCNLCGHCKAICPQNAIRFENGSVKQDNAEREPIVLPDIDPDLFLDFQKKRRSIRHFEEKQIEQSDIDKLIEAGRYSPTGGNLQRNHFIVIRDSKKELTDRVFEALNKMSKDDEFLEKNDSVRYKKVWHEMYLNYIDSGEDRLFYNAPLIMAISSKDGNISGAVNAGIAASRIELLADSMGIGVCFIGFLRRAMEYDPTIGECLGLEKNEKLLISFILGYPSSTYYDIPNRDGSIVSYI